MLDKFAPQMSRILTGLTPTLTMATNQTELARKDEGQLNAERMDELDEAQIAKEMEGKVIEEYFYTFKENGVTKVGLSFAGVKYMAGLMRNEGHPLSVEYTNIELSPDGSSWLGNAVVKDLATGEKRAGHFEQPKLRYEKPNPFAYTLAGSKAERNAMRHFMPEAAIVKAKKEWESNHGNSGIKDVTVESKVTEPKKYKEIKA
jgi:hypothetical protein